jgi:putative DNA primase/helicase
MIAETSRGALLAERLGIESLGREGHNVKAACVSCDSSDAFRVHQDTGVAFCHSCNGRWSRLQLAEHILGDRRAAWSLLEELGLEQPRHRTNGHHDGNGKPVDPIEAIAKAKHVTADALRAYGATVTDGKVLLPAYDPDGKQCSTFTLTTGKGLFAKGQKAGLFFPHVDGSVRLPQPGETWHGVEGPKDAAALYELGLLAFGMNTNHLAAKFARLFAGVDVVLIPDRDTAGVNGSEQSARALFGNAASIRIAHLPSEVKNKGGEDVRDILRREGGQEQVEQAIKDALAWKPPAPTSINSGALDLPSIESADGRTDVANARRLVALHGDKIRWVDPWGKWLIWDARRWAIDNTRLIETLARDVFYLVWKQAAELRADKGAIQFARSVGGEHSIKSMINLARSEPGIAIDPKRLDADGWLLNCLNGTVNLRTGELQKPDPEDLITRLCPVAYDPQATAPVLESFLTSITAGNHELVEFLRRGAGCSAVGQVVEHALFFCYGMGANGKTTFLQAVADTLGDEYAMAAPPDLLMVKHGQQHPTELADLHGKRFVSCIEAGEGRRLAESLVKSLTGGDKVRARRMREDFWQFAPSHTIWLAANHKPIIRGTDDGIWRRMRLVPFTVSIPPERQDKQLPDKLKAEAAGVLAWIIRGCLEWQRHGLGLPDAVSRATSDYREESDLLGEFIAECCTVGNPVRTKSSELYAGYLTWCERSKDRPISKTAFGDALEEKGFTKTKSVGIIWRSGIELRENF